MTRFIRVGVPLLILLYLITLFALAPTSILGFDTYYYWQWSKHLDWSYYDGPPMIAYWMYLSTLLFGDTLLAFSFIGIAVLFASSFLLYKIGRMFLSKEASVVAMLLWLFSPTATRFLICRSTYDAPLTLFWITTLYCCLKYMNTERPKWLYLLATSAGLMLLSKYSGVVLLLGLFIFLLCSKYKTLLKQVHFYLALGLIFFIFSPVLVWNFKQAWTSFSYQLTTHQFADSDTGAFVVRLLKNLFKAFLPALNFLLIPPFYYLKNKDKQKPDALRLMQYVCVTFLCFYLFIAFKVKVNDNWLLQYLMSAALLAAHYYQHLPIRRPLWILIGVYALLSFSFVLFSSPMQSSFESRALLQYRLIQALNEDYPTLGRHPIFTYDWLEARAGFFLNGQPTIHTLKCDLQPRNQYLIWDAPIQKQLESKAIRKAYFWNTWGDKKADLSHCAQQYFDRCEPIPTRVHDYRGKAYQLNLLKCVND